MAAVSLRLSTIPTVSPSLAELLSQCPLRAGISRVDQANLYVLNNPKAWLGTAYHEVMATAATCEQDLEEIWNRSVLGNFHRSQAHPLNSRFGIPESWPGYYVIRAMALMRATGLYSEGRSLRAGSTTSTIPPKLDEGSEKWLSAAGGRLIGRPDLISGDTLIDFKTGNIFETGEGEEVKLSYLKQLQIYAYLIHESLGYWPKHAVLLPMEGPSFEIDLQPSLCIKEANEALEMLQQYNEAIRNRVDLSNLARPSSTNCRWCPYQILCPFFWPAANEDWKENYIGAVSGKALIDPQPIYHGEAFQLSLQNDLGTVRRNQEINLSPLKTEIHHSLTDIQEGSEIRVVGLRVRSDGTLSACLHTVIFITSDLPTIEVMPAVE